MDDFEHLSDFDNYKNGLAYNSNTYRKFLQAVKENELHTGKFFEDIDDLETNDVEMRRVVEKIYPIFKKDHVEKISRFVKDFKKQIMDDFNGNALFQLVFITLDYNTLFKF